MYIYMYIYIDLVRPVAKIYQNLILVTYLATWTALWSRGFEMGRSKRNPLDPVRVNSMMMMMIIIF